eukprot:gnl/Spiro4/16669_TR8963_c0_g1_i1.p1 gnl/Spiro4/16669_TR8963_c0_g1~~gnl/Spiro4/16669_TR8963_c0_g1_i1.p1  ORF type:complete len:337 (-),score=48.80 gnl/Spiro4/16669_TR8963_c0_g1_i1:126-1064(-)
MSYWGSYYNDSDPYYSERPPPRNIDPYPDPYFSRNRPPWEEDRRDFLLPPQSHRSMGGFVPREPLLPPSSRSSYFPPADQQRYLHGPPSFHHPHPRRRSPPARPKSAFNKSLLPAKRPPPLKGPSSTVKKLRPSPATSHTSPTILNKNKKKKGPRDSTTSSTTTTTAAKPKQTRFEGRASVKCPVCPGLFGFPTEAAMKRHEIKVHFKCHDCNLTFTSSPDANAHISTHDFTATATSSSSTTVHSSTTTTTPAATGEGTSATTEGEAAANGGGDGGAADVDDAATDAGDAHIAEHADANSVDAQDVPGTPTD